MIDGLTAPGLSAAIRSLIEARTGDAVFVAGPDYRISHRDREATFLTGIRSEDVLGKHCYEVVFGEREDGGSFCTNGCSVMRFAHAGSPVSSYDMRVSFESDEEPDIVHLLRDSRKTHETIEMAQSLIKLSKRSERHESETYPETRTELPALTPRQLEKGRWYIASVGKDTGRRA